MQFPLPFKRGVIPPGRPRIDWSHPLAWGLTGAYLPSPFGNTIYDLTGVGVNLAVQSGATFTNGQDGRALVSTASSSGAVGTLTPAQKPTAQASVFYRASWNGNFPTSPCTIAGAIFDNLGNSPFDAYNITIDAGTGIYPATNVSGTPTTGTTFTSVPTNTIFSTSMSVKMGSTLDLWFNGVNQSRFSIGAGSISYDTTPQMCLAEYQPIPTRVTGMTSYVMFTWNRVLTDAEHSYLSKNPYGFLIFPDDDIFSLIGTFGSPSITRTTTKRQNSKWYFEVTVNAALDVTKIAVGLDDGTESLTGSTGQIGSIAWFGNGNVAYNGNPTAYTAATFAVGDTLGIAIDFDNDLVWFRDGSGNWNNDVIGNQNPATDTGGFSISLLHYPLYGIAQVTSATDQITGRFKSTDQLFTMPVGYVAWGGNFTNVSITGVSAIGAVGTLVAEIDAIIIGVFATGAVASVTPQVGAIPSGVFATGAVTSPTAKVDITLTGVFATGAITAPSVQISPTLTGVFATGVAGTSTVEVDVTITGVFATGVLGTPTIQIVNTQSTNVFPIGVFATGILGTLHLPTQIGIIGLPALGGIGTMQLIQHAPATSLTRNFDLTYADIMIQAFQQCGFTREGIYSQDVMICMQHLNLIIAEWVSKAPMDVMIDKQTIGISFGQQSIITPQATDDIHSLWLTRQFGSGPTDLIMRRITRQYYDAYPNKFTPGLPSAYYVDRNATPTIWLWQPSNRNDDVISYYRIRKISDAVVPNQITGLPSRWLDALVAELASFIGKLRKLPIPVSLMLDTRAKTAYKMAAAQERDRSSIILMP